MNDNQNPIFTEFEQQLIINALQIFVDYMEKTKVMKVPIFYELLDTLTTDGTRITANTIGAEYYGKFRKAVAHYVYCLELNSNYEAKNYRQLLEKIDKLMKEQK